jgi:hypothetical protein
LAHRWLDKDNAQANYNKRTSPRPSPPHPPNPLCSNQRLEACIAQVPLTPFVGYNCCPCCSNAFALLVVPVAPIRNAFIASSHTLHAYLHTSLLPSRNNMRSFTVSSPLPPRALYHHSHGLNISHIHAGISPRTPNRIVILAPAPHAHVSFPLSRMAHAYPAIQRNRQPVGSFLVLPQYQPQPQRQSPESSKIEPLGFFPGTWAWVLQALPISCRGAEMVGRVGANSSLLCTFGRAL